MINTSAITAIGTANPQYRQLQTDAAALITQNFQLSKAEQRLINSVYKATGIDSRFSVLGDYKQRIGEFDYFPTAARMKIYKQNALGLAIAAIQDCLANLHTFNPQQISHLITVSCTGMYAPGLDIEIVQKLNLPSTTKRTAINFMGCYGAFNALKIADAICKSTPDANVLIVSVELCTIHLQKFSGMDNIISSAIFADGAAALLLQSRPETKKYLSLEHFHCDLIAQSQQAMAWEIGDTGFDIVLSSYVPEMIKSGIAAFVQNLMYQAKLALEEIDIYAIHPGGLKILQACEVALNITPAQNKYAYNTLKAFGNMSSATILFILKAILQDLTLPQHQKNIFSCAFGPGLTIESMLLKTHCT